MPSSAARCFATGASESASLHAPSFGRPRCEVTITRAPAASAARIPGSEARIRVSSEIFPASIGTFRSARISTRLPFRSTSAMRLNLTEAAGTAITSRS